MKLLLVFLTVFLTASAVHAQRTGATVLNVYGGYTFKDKVDFGSFYGYVDEAIQYGGGIEYFAHSTRSVEIKYVRMDTHFPLYANGGTKLNEGSDDGAVSYLLIGGNNYFGSSDSKVSPYFGGGLGVGFVSLKDGGDATEFAYEFKLGMRVNTASAVSYKFQAYFQSILASVGSDFYYSGGGVIAVPDQKSINQFGLTAILSFDFSHAKK
jgi:hypothetical protein